MNRKDYWDEEMRRWRACFKEHKLFQDPAQHGIWTLAKLRESPVRGADEAISDWTVPKRSSDGVIDQVEDQDGSLVGYHPRDFTRNNRMDIALVPQMGIVMMNGDHSLASFAYHSYSGETAREHLLSVCQWMASFAGSPGYGAEKFSLAMSGSKPESAWYDSEQAEEEILEWIHGMREAAPRAHWCDDEYASAGLGRDAMQSDEEAICDLEAMDDGLDRPSPSATPEQIARYQAKVEAHLDEMESEVEELYDRTLMMEWVMRHGGDPTECSYGKRTPEHVAMAAAIAERILAILGAQT